MDVMAALRERIAKAKTRVARATKALESAKKELIDLAAAERVMADITGESVETKSLSGITSDRDRDITKLLGVGPAEAKSPADLHPDFIAAHGAGLNLDAFRTALWRLQKKVIHGDELTWSVRSDNGRYWRQSDSEGLDDFDELLGGASGS